MKRILLAGAATLVLMQGCGEQRANPIPVARCGTAELYVQENELYYLDSRRRRVELAVSTLGNYRTSLLDRLRIYRQPLANDWQLYVAPTSLAPDEYEMLATCIGAQLADIDGKMAVSRQPRSLQSQEMASPRIATIRYASLGEMRKQYMCQPEGTLRVNEDGRVWLERDVAVLLGFVIEGGKGVALKEDSLRYWAVGAPRRIADPVGYLRGCKERNGRSMFEDFEVAL